MPIRFRCGYCNRLLGIARRKAGTETTCPYCGYTITVPEPEEPAEERNEFADLDLLLNPSAPAPAAAESEQPPSTPQTEVSKPTRPRPAPRPVTSPASAPASDGDQPLFERDVDSLLGVADETGERPGAPRPRTPTSGIDATSLGHDPGQLVLSPQRATALAIGVVILLALSFAAGYLLALAR